MLIRFIKELMQRLGELSPSCREATRLQSEALDRLLPVSKRIGLRIHLILCKWCRRYGKQIGFLRAAAQQHPEHEERLPTQSLRPEVRARIKRSLQAEEK